MSLIEDEIEAELRRHLQTTDPHMLQSVAEHATIVAALAERVRQTIVHACSDETFHQSTLTAELAKRWSTHADQLVVQASRRLTRASERTVRQLLIEADGAADALEEAAFMLTLLPDSVDPETLALLVGLADLVADTVRQYVRCSEAGRDLSSTSTTRMWTFLVGIDRLIDVHRQASAKKRTLTERLLRARRFSRSACRRRRGARLRADLDRPRALRRPGPRPRPAGPARPMTRSRSCLYRIGIIRCSYRSSGHMTYGREVSGFASRG